MIALNISRKYRLILEDEESFPLLEGPEYRLENGQSSIISRLLQSFDGRLPLAESMVSPLRRSRDYVAMGRRTFLVEQLPQGALPIYDRGYSIGSQGDT